MLHAKNYYNRPMSHGAIQKIKVASFFGTRCSRLLHTCTQRRS